MTTTVVIPTSLVTETNVTLPSNESRSTEKCFFLTFDTAKIDEVAPVYLVAAALDAILIFPTIALNILLIVSLYRSTEIRKPSSKLLFSLALSDVLVGLLVEPALLAKKIAEVNHNLSMYCYTGIITYVIGGGLGCVSFFTLTAIGVDRYLVVHKGTIYRTWVTNKRVLILLFLIWVAAFVLYTGHFYISRSLYFKVAALVMATCAMMTSLCYVKCFATLRKQKQKICDLNEGTAKEKARNTFRYKKTMDTMCLVFVAFILCYLPFIGTAVVTVVLGESAATWGAESISTIFVFSNSLINPIILLVRIKEIRRAITNLVSVTNPNSSH